MPHPGGGKAENAERIDRFPGCPPSPSAYSDLVKTADGKLGVLYENGAKEPYDRISFNRLEVE